jgi:hypothetical protein
MHWRERRMAAVAALLFSALSGQAAPLDTSCAKFVAAYAARGQGSLWPPSAGYADYRWYEGYVTGWLSTNNAAPDAPAFVAEEVDDATRWLDSACRDHPEEKLGMALRGFVGETEPAPASK